MTGIENFFTLEVDQTFFYDRGFPSDLELGYKCFFKGNLENFPAFRQPPDIPGYPPSYLKKKPGWTFLACDGWKTC